MQPGNYSILDVLVDAVLVIGRDYSIIFANRAFTGLYALKTDEIVGRYCFELFHHRFSPCDSHATLSSPCSCAEAFRTGQPVIVTRRLIMPAGAIRFFEITTSPIKNDQGEVAAVVQIRKDITATVELQRSAETCHLEFKQILDNVPDAVVYLDRDMKVLQMNPQVEKNAGITSSQARGKFCYDLWGQYAHDENRKGLDRICAGCRTRESLTTGQSYLLERRLGDRIIEVLTVPVRDRDDSIVGTMEIGRDVTEQKQAQLAVQISESRYRILFNDSPIPLCVADFSVMKQRIDALIRDIDTDLPAYFVTHPEKTSEILSAFKLIDMNQACRKLFGFEETTDIQTNLAAILGKIPLHETPEGLIDLALGNLSSSHDITLYSMQGKKVHAILRWAVESGSEKNYNRVLLSLNDITERKVFQNELRMLTQRLEEAEETERRRLSRELHDEVGQNITALGINLQLISNGSAAAMATQARNRLDESISLVETIADQVRSVTTELRSPVLDDYGLLAGLRLLGQQFSTRTGLRVTVAGDETPRTSIAKETALFRVAREAMTNVVKHARAHHVAIVLKCHDHTLHLEISDDGTGFDPQATRKASQGIGLLSMRERVEAFQGRFSLAAAPGRGTKISVEMPL
ncbi:MAG: sensor histidine kinase [Desulfobulbaceae bacterium]